MIVGSLMQKEVMVRCQTTKNAYCTIILQFIQV